VLPVGVAAVSRRRRVLSGGASADISGTPNAPVGYTAIVNQPMDAVLFTDSGVTWLNGAGYPNGEATVTVFTDASAPESPSNVLRFTYDFPFDSNNGPGLREGVFGEAYSALYTCLWVKPSTTWENHPSGVNKFFYWTARNTDAQNGTCFISMNYNSTPAPVGFQFYTQNPGEDQEVFSTSGFTPILGEHHRIEVLLERTSGILGRVRMWCSNESNPSPVLGMDQTGVQLTDAGESVVAWTGVNLDPVWGGNTSVSTRSFTLDFDHLLITGTPE
jgi:hypothetical protein